MSEPIVLTDTYVSNARAVPGAYWDGEAGGWVLDKDGLTGRTAIVALKLFPHLSLPYPELEKARDAMIQEVRPFDNATSYGKHAVAKYVEGRLAADHHAFYEYQSLDLGYLADIIRRDGGGYIGWQRGLGKTLAALTIAEELQADSVLVICSNTAKGPVWADEASIFWPWEVEVLPNEKKKREWCMERVLRAKREGRRIMLIVHYESLHIIGHLKNKAGKGWDKYGPWDLTVADEVHRFKNPKAKQTRALKKIPSLHRLALSGSIIENEAEELFSVAQWLFPDRYKAMWRDWNDRFLDYVENGAFGKVCVGVRLDRLKAMQDELGVWMVYRRKKDELDLPKRVDIERKLDLSPGQRQVYEQLRDGYIAEIDARTKIVATDGLTMLTKLRQVATGLDLLSPNVTDSTKLDFAADMIEENDEEAFVVFSWFKAAAHAMEARLSGAGIDSFLIDGDVKSKHRPGLVRRFAKGERRVFIGTLSTIGESVNLQKANNAIFLDRSWNPATNVQAADRIDRIGQTLPVTITYLVARDTVDETHVQPTIRNKQALRALILGAN